MASDKLKQAQGLMPRDSKKNSSRGRTPTRNSARSDNDDVESLRRDMQATMETVLPAPFKTGALVEVDIPASGGIVSVPHGLEGECNGYILVDNLGVAVDLERYVKPNGGEQRQTHIVLRATSGPAKLQLWVWR